jgi:hypothetical protein
MRGGSEAGRLPRFWLGGTAGPDVMEGFATPPRGRPRIEVGDAIVWYATGHQRVRARHRRRRSGVQDRTRVAEGTLAVVGRHANGDRHPGSCDGADARGGGAPGLLGPADELPAPGQSCRRPRTRGRETPPRQGRDRPANPGSAGRSRRRRFGTPPGSPRSGGGIPGTISGTGRRPPRPPLGRSGPVLRQPVMPPTGPRRRPRPRRPARHRARAPWRRRSADAAAAPSRCRRSRRTRRSGTPVRTRPRGRRPAPRQ